MRKNLFRRFEDFFTLPSLIRQRRNRKKPLLERLEDRTVPTSTLYVEFGDRFPTAGLTGTMNDLVNRSTPGNPVINGPQLDALTAPVRMRGFNRTNTTGNDAADRVEIMTLLRRYYEPFDITVVELTATPQTVNGYQVRAAANFDEMSTLLGLNEGETKNNDAIVFVGQTVINGFNQFVFSQAFGGGLLGVASGNDVNAPLSNRSDGFAFTFMDDSTDFFESNIQLALTTAHEAGHLFGLDHAVTNFFGTPTPAGIDPDIPVNEIMAYRDIPGYAMFSRFPTVRGDGNTNVNTLSTGNVANTIYDQFAKDPQIGPNPNLEYVTGTGANDVITITKTGDNEATVTVEAFTNANFTGAIRVPKIGGTKYTYTIALDKPIRIDAGARNDRIVLDGDLGATVTIYGMQGTDSVIIDGKGADSATYVPSTNTALGLDGQSDLRGSLVLSGTTFNFQEFEAASSLQLTNVKNVLLQTPGGSDEVTLSAATGGFGRLSGTADGATFVPLLFSGLTNLTIDVANNDVDGDNDTVIIDASIAANVSGNFLVQTGAGDDTLNVSVPTLALPASGLQFLAGDGENTLNLDSATITMPANPTRPAIDFVGGANNDTFNLSAQTVSLPATGLSFQGGAGDDSFNVASESISLPTGVTTAPFTFVAEGGEDRLTFTANTLTLSGAFTFEGGSEVDTLDMSGVQSLTLPEGFLFNGGAGDDSLMAGFTSISLSGGGLGAGFTFNGDAGNDSLELFSTVLNLPAGGFVFNGGTEQDTFTTSLTEIRLPDGATGPGFTFNGNDGNDALTLSATTLTLPAGGFLFDGGANDDSLEIASSTLTMPAGATGPAFTFTGGTEKDTLLLTATTLNLPEGRFDFIAGEGDDTLQIAAATITLPVGSVATAFTFQGEGGADTVKLTATTLNLPAGGFEFQGGDGNDSLELVATSITLPIGAAGKAFTFDGGLNDDSLKLTGATLMLPAGGFLFTGGDGNDRLEGAFTTLAVATGNGAGFEFDAGNDADTLVLTATTLNLPAGGFLYNAGDGDDALEVAFSVLTLPAGGTGIEFNGAGGDDRLALQAATLRMPANGVRFNGGDADDTLEVGFGDLTIQGAGTIGVRFNGGDGLDALKATGTPNRRWLFTGNKVGTMNERLFFEEVDTLTSGDGDDRFEFRANGQFLGDIDAGKGNDSINFAVFTNVPATLLNLGAADGFDVALGGANPVQVKNINELIARAGGADAFTAPANAAGTWTVTATGSTYGMTGGNTLRFTGFDRFRGGAGADTFTVSNANGAVIAATGMTFDGQGGFDTVRVVGSAAADSFGIGVSSVLVNGRQLTLANTEDLDVFGGAGNDSFNSSNAVLGFAMVELFGDAGNDTFSLTVSTSTVFRVFGDSPGRPMTPGDSLVIRRSAVEIVGARPSRTATTGTFQFAGGRKRIDFVGIERYNEGRTQMLPG